MDTKLEPIVKIIQEKFSAVLEEFRGEVHLFVTSEQIVEALTLLRDEHKFELLSVLNAVDYYPQTEPRFHVVYQLTSISRNLSLQVRVPVNGDNPKLPTVTGVYAVANWRERELLDMFGIEFEGHPDPRRILTPGFEEPQFTFNFDEIRVQKPSPKE
jgi:NADH-quinone oxidoreductase subunit C